jgi:hypothetical protein
MKGRPSLIFDEFSTSSYCGYLGCRIGYNWDNMTQQLQRRRLLNDFWTK